MEIDSILQKPLLNELLTCKPVVRRAFDRIGAAEMTERTRTDWVDYAKGISIILVVMMHSTLSSEEALHRIGWMH